MVFPIVPFVLDVRAQCGIDAIEELALGFVILGQELARDVLDDYADEMFAWGVYSV